MIRERSERFVTQIKELMPKNYQFCYLPIRFSVADPERIGSILSEKFRGFYIGAGEESFFAAACQVFPFPNEISSVRVIIAIINKVEGMDLDEEEEEEDDKIEGLDDIWDDEENKNILEELVINN